MPVGYSLPSPSSVDSYEQLREGFEWTIPETFNIADVVADAEADGNGSENADGGRGADGGGDGHAVADPEAVALSHVDESGDTHTFTYRELDAAAAAVGAHLVGAGLEPGDRVGLCFPQSPELLVAHLAVYRAGCVAVPLSVLLGDESFAYTVEHSGASALLADAAARESFAGAVDDREFALDLSVRLDGEEYVGEHRHLGGFAETVAPDETIGVEETAPDDPALVLYTSGTTGDPKGVVQGHQYLLGSLPGYQCWFHLFGDGHHERVWTPAEWAWAGALFDVVFPTLAMGGTVVSRVRRAGFDPADALALAESQRVSRAFLPPTALWQLREETDPSAHDLALDVVICGGEALSPGVFEWAEDALGATVNETYGQTEANALVGNCQALFEARPGSMGRPYPGHDVRLVDDGCEPVAPGEVGEIALRVPDPVLFEEYWEDADAIAAAFCGRGSRADDGDGGDEGDSGADDEGRWFLTGDLAVRDDDSYLRFQGRADELIVTAGYRVDPTEVEAALRDSPAVSAVAVGSGPDEERGQVVAAAIVPEDPDAADDELADELRERVADAVGRHKVPRRIEFVRDPPETRTGKLDRSALFPDS